MKHRKSRKNWKVAKRDEAQWWAIGEISSVPLHYDKSSLNVVKKSISEVLVYCSQKNMSIIEAKSLNALSSLFSTKSVPIDEKVAVS